MSRDPFLQLVRVGQFADQEQVGDFQESAVLRQFLDRIAAVAQNAAVAIDVRDGALAGCGIHKCRVVSHQAEIIRTGLDLPQIHRADRSLLHGKV